MSDIRFIGKIEIYLTLKKIIDIYQITERSVSLFSFYRGNMISKKESIINAATLLFTRKGFIQTRASDISDMTGVAEGTIFYHFKSKEGLFLYILKKFKEDIIQEYDQYKKNNIDQSGLDMLESSISFYLNLASGMEDRFLLLHRHDAYELAKINGACKEVLVVIYECFFDIFETAILEGQKDGSIIELPPRKTAMIIFSMADGVARFDTYDLYDAGSLYSELIQSCRRMLKKQKDPEVEFSDDL